MYAFSLFARAARIHMIPVKTRDWTEVEKIKKRIDAFRSMGFEDIGAYRLNELGAPEDTYLAYMPGEEKIHNAALDERELVNRLQQSRQAGTWMVITRDSFVSEFESRYAREADNLHLRGASVQKIQRKVETISTAFTSLSVRTRPKRIFFLALLPGNQTQAPAFATARFSFGMTFATAIGAGCVVLPWLDDLLAVRATCRTSF